MWSRNASAQKAIAATANPAIMIACTCIQASPFAAVMAWSTFPVLFTSWKLGWTSIVVPRVTAAITNANPEVRSME